MTLQGDILWDVMTLAEVKFNLEKEPKGEIDVSQNDAKWAATVIKYSSQETT